ncbi:hypothetical protein [Agrobacterium larrymoorei]|uniref:Uncharacterized protein n=1 Tax=Agrobacterium larrymoorei TaxID=160699 RepID=A0AAF0H9C1_9HYPH|nr:hypothetical protein [Agrobacterium larrymoorei]WHA40173.1 hypothetical protein CFBP5477_010030 [Agrobacterium larrymoorei]
MTNFSDQIPRSNEAYEFLPLFHTCEAFQARTYIKNRELKTTDVCEVFEEPITYLFYGRPAYKYAVKGGGHTNLANYPVCFIFDVDLLPEIKRIYPFDTGALHHKMLSNFIHSDNTVAHFELEPERNRIADIVLHFHGSNQNYLSGTVDPKTYDPLDFESIAYTEMHKSYVPDKSDERRITIEVHAPEMLRLKDGSLKAMIIPTPMLGSKLLNDFVDDTEVDVRTYDIDIWDPIYGFAGIARVARSYIAEMAARSDVE